MSIYSNVTEQDLINLGKLAEQQKNKRAEKIKNRILKQTHDVKLAESLSPITKTLDTINESTKNLGKEIKESNSRVDIKALPNSSKFSNSMRQMIGSIINSRNSLKSIQDELNRATVLGVPIQISEGDTIKVNENIYELTPEIYKASTYQKYTGKTMKNENDILMTNNIKRHLAYTGIRERDSNRKSFFTKKRPKLAQEIQNRTFEGITGDSDDFQGEGMKIIIPSNLNDIYTRLEILVGLKLSGHTDTLTEASNLIDELYKRGEIQNKQHIEMLLTNFLLYKLTIIFVFFPLKKFYINIIFRQIKNNLYSNTCFFILC